MSFSINPKDGPTIAQPPGASARDRAIAALTAKAQPQTSPVQNANQVSPEELGVVMPPSQGQNTLSEGNVSETVSSSPAAPESEKAAPEGEETKSAPLSSQYAQLARREKALRAKAVAQEAQLRAKEADLAAKEQAFLAREAQMQTSYIQKDRLKSDTVSVLAEAGLTMEEIVNLANQPQLDPWTKAQMSKLEAEIQRLREDSQASKKGQEEQKTQAYQQAIKQIDFDAQALVTSQPDDFEMIKAWNATKEITKLIERTWEKDKVVLSVEDAAREVEDYLVERAARISKSKKLQPQQTPPAPASQAQKQEIPKQPSTKTLTNSVSSPRQLSARERALLAFKGELK